MNVYSFSYKLLHWSMALLLCLMLFAFWGFNPELSAQERTTMLVGHSSIGTIISVLFIIRFTKRFVLNHQRPEITGTQQQKQAAKVIHKLMYLFMFMVPATGYATANFHQLPVKVFAQFSLNSHADLTLFNTLKTLHLSAIYGLISLVLVHLVAAIYHKLVLKDQTMAKMRPWFTKS